MAARRSGKLEQTPGDQPDQAFATTLAHGLSILSAFRVGETKLSNGELARRTGLSRPTVSRLTYTLEVLGHLRRDRKGRYKLGGKVLSDAYPLLAGLRLRQAARPLLREFAAFTGGTVSIGMPLGLSCVYVETVRTSELSSHVPETGFTVLMAETAMGRALLSLYPEDEFAAFRTLAEARLPDWSILEPRVTAAIDACHDRGFCLVLGEWKPEIFGVAAPLYRTLDGEYFAINCGIPAFRFTRSEVEDICGPRLEALARNIRGLVDPESVYLPDTTIDARPR